MRNLLMLALSLCLSPAAPVLAGEGREGENAQAVPPPCASDAQSLCAGMRPGDGKFGPCMKENLGKLSPECRAMVSGKMAGEDGRPDGNDGATAGRGKQDGRRAMKACRDAARTVCPGMRPGDGKFGPCIKEHRADLPACGEVLARWRARKHPGKSEACRAAIQKACPDMRPGDGKLGACMKEHREELSGCRSGAGPGKPGKAEGGADQGEDEIESANDD